MFSSWRRNFSVSFCSEFHPPISMFSKRCRPSLLEEKDWRLSCRGNLDHYLCKVKNLPWWKAFFSQIKEAVPFLVKMTTNKLFCIEKFPNGNYHRNGDRILPKGHLQFSSFAAVWPCDDQGSFWGHFQVSEVIGQPAEIRASLRAVLFSLEIFWLEFKIFASGFRSFPFKTIC